MSRSLHIVDRFAPEAKALRAHFDERFENPRSTRSDRFVWDYWHVPGQYTALRTPAWMFFPQKTYEAFHQRLVMWGRRTLGCHDVSPPWMSCYVEGCGQELHGDVPHGPWAFVFSLTPQGPRMFSGGQTLIVQDDVLDYWSSFESSRIVEERHLITEVDPRFGRLTVFDPRLPHGVRRVQGTHDVRFGRLVVHGWFVQPRPFIEGPVPSASVQQALDDLVGKLGALIPEGLEPAGLLSVRIEVDRAGAVSKARVLSDTTRVPALHEPMRVAFLKKLLAAVRAMKFARARGPSSITLPLVFER